MNTSRALESYHNLYLRCKLSSTNSLNAIENYIWRNLEVHIDFGVNSD